MTRHQDDHTRSIAFLGDQDADGGSPPRLWQDMRHNPGDRCTSRRPMTINGRHDGFTRDDLRAPWDGPGAHAADRTPRKIVGSAARCPDCAHETGGYAPRPFVAYGRAGRTSLA